MKYTVFEKNRIMHWRLMVVCVVLMLLTLGREVNGQEAESLGSPNVPIPEDSYRSWSLFLISNPEWILPGSNDNLMDLYEIFEAFGRAIGPDHLAVWFWREYPRYDMFYKSVDVLRSSAFCQRLKLPPSGGPYILVTTEYPGTGQLGLYPETFPDDLKNFCVLKLNGADASEIMRLLTELADQLVAGNLDELDPQSEEYWRTWQSSFEAIRDTLVGFSKKVNLRIKTSFFEVEI